MRNSTNFYLTKVREGKSNNLRIDTNVERILKFLDAAADIGESDVFGLSPDILTVRTTSIEPVTKDGIAIVAETLLENSEFNVEVKLFFDNDISPIDVNNQYITTKQVDSYSYYINLSSLYGDSNETVKQALREYWSGIQITTISEEAVSKIVYVSIGHKDDALKAEQLQHKFSQIINGKSWTFSADGFIIRNTVLDIENSQGNSVFHADASGNLSVTGKIYATDGVFKGTVYATNGEFKGKIVAGSGKIGGFVIDDNNIYCPGSNKSNPLVNSPLRLSSNDHGESRIYVQNINIGTGAVIDEYLRLGNLKLWNPEVESTDNPNSNVIELKQSLYVLKGDQDDENSDFEQGGLSDGAGSRGANLNSNTRIRTKGFIQVNPGQQYSFVIDPIKINDKTIKKIICYYDEGKNDYLHEITNASDNVTINSKAKYIRIVLCKDGTTWNSTDTSDFITPQNIKEFTISGDTNYFTLTNNGYIEGNNWYIKKVHGYGGITAKFGRVIAEDGVFNGIIRARDGVFTGEVTASTINATTLNTVNFVTEKVRAMGGSFIFKPVFSVSKENISKSINGDYRLIHFKLDNDDIDYFGEKTYNINDINLTHGYISSSDTSRGVELPGYWGNFFISDYFRVTPKITSYTLNLETNLDENILLSQLRIEYFYEDKTPYARSWACYSGSTFTTTNFEQGGIRVNGTPGELFDSQNRIRTKSYWDVPYPKTVKCILEVEENTEKEAAKGWIYQFKKNSETQAYELVKQSDLPIKGPFTFDSEATHYKVVLYREGSTSTAADNKYKIFPNELVRCGLGFSTISKTFTPPTVNKKEIRYIRIAFGRGAGFNATTSTNENLAISTTSLKTFELVENSVPTNMIVSVSDGESGIRLGRLHAVNKDTKTISVDFAASDYTNYTPKEQNTITLFGRPHNELLIGINSDDSKVGNILPKRSLVMEGFSDISDGRIKYNPHLILGDLSQLASTVVGNEENAETDLTGEELKYITGYGLYADNVFLRGSLMTATKNQTCAGVNTQRSLSFNYNTWNSKPIELDEGYSGEKIVFWGGANSLNERDVQESPFIVTDKGSIFASRGVFKGAVLSDSLITNTIIKTPVLYGTGDDPSLKIYSTSSWDSNNNRSRENGGIAFYRQVGGIDAESTEKNDRLTLSISTTGFTHYHYADAESSTIDRDHETKFIEFFEHNQKGASGYANPEYINFRGTKLYLKDSFDEIDNYYTTFSESLIKDVRNGAAAEIHIKGQSDGANEGVRLKYKNTSLLVYDEKIYNYTKLTATQGEFKITKDIKDESNKISLDYRISNGYYCLYVNQS